MKNYLEILAESINLFDLGDLLKEIHNKYGKEIRKIFIRKVDRSLYYYWLSNKSPIKIKHLKEFKKFDSQILNKSFKKVKYFSARNKKVILPKILSKELAYLIGAIHGDGHVHKSKKNLHLTEENKEYHEKIIKNYFKETFDVDSYISKISEGKSYRSTISSKVIVSFLSQFCPIGKKKGLLKIPAEIKQNKELLKEYLSGLFDTDGCLTHIEKGRKSFYFTITQSDKNFVFDIFNALKKLDLEINEPKSFISPSKPYAKDRKLIEWRIYIGSKKTLKTFLNIITFKHPLKSMRAKLISQKLVS